MKLPAADADLFFKLMWGLQFYVNQQRGILPDIDSVEDYVALPMADKAQVRNALWENPALIDAYPAENPDGLSAEELEIIRKWKRFVAGTFYIFRYLKKHAIFISGEDAKVYGVLALYESLEDVLYGRRLPVMVQAVLLPFKGKIIYDGMLSGYNIFFGRGIRSSLNEEYMAAKQNERIITTLEPELAKPTRRRRKKPGKDWRPVVDELVEKAEKIKGGPAAQSAAFSLFRAGAKLAQAAAHNPDDLDELWKQERRVRTALSRLQTVLARAER
ncbi:MAG TPA: hypothetical protein EYP49_21595 [Anaerolineae bacterium]|nr:hypothetical protein [Anaerolineae bacterium]